MKILRIKIIGVGLTIVVLAVTGCSDKPLAEKSASTDINSSALLTTSLQNLSSNTPTVSKRKSGAQPESALELETMMKDTEQAMGALEARLGSQDTRLSARAMANMSDRQMAELKLLRKSEVVMRSDGVLMLPYAEQGICEAGDVCRTTITNTQTNQTIYDGNWAQGYTQTGVGKEVVRVQ